MRLQTAAAIIFLACTHKGAPTCAWLPACGELGVEKYGSRLVLQSCTDITRDLRACPHPSFSASLASLLKGGLTNSSCTERIIISATADIMPWPKCPRGTTFLPEALKGASIGGI